MLSESELQKLLRLKRHEVPPPDYFENFLDEFHRNQRRELLRTPLLVIWRDRLAGFFAGFEVPRMAYAGALGGFAVLALSMGMFREEPARLAAQPVRENAPGLSLAAQPVDYLPAVHGGQVLNGQSFPTRYVLDTRPVSFEPPFGF